LGLFAIFGSKFIPKLLPQYKLPVEIFGLILVVFFVFQSGREHEYDKAKSQRIADKLQIDTLTAETLRVNTQLSENFIKKTVNVKGIKNEQTIIYVPKEADSKCIIEPTVSVDIARLLNSAIEGKLPTTTSGTDGKTK
jgi:hypothetical protein